MNRVLAVIPARGGSKGVPDKNIRALHGVPLISHTIRVARSAKVIDKIVVSTDSDVIADIAHREGGVEVIMRPLHLAQDNSLVVDSLRHVVYELQRRDEQFDNLILLQPTSPFRIIDDIRMAVDLLGQDGINSVASFTESSEPPARLWRIANTSIEPFIPGSNAFLPRQALEKGYCLNGLIYGMSVMDLMINVDSSSILFGNTMPMITPQDRAMDIDTLADFDVSEFMFKSFLTKYRDSLP